MLINLISKGFKLLSPDRLIKTGIDIVETIVNDIPNGEETAIEKKIQDIKEGDDKIEDIIEIISQAKPVLIKRIIGIVFGNMVAHNPEKEKKE